MGSPSWETDREQLAGQRVIESSTKRKVIQPPRLCVARRLVRPPADGAASASCCGACEVDEAVRSKTDDIVPFEKWWRLECYRGTQYLVATVVGGGVHSGRQTGHYGDVAVDESPLSQR